MPDKARFLDVWLVDANTVYREVPFTVVSDWVQQGRLLENDMLKPAGSADWLRVGSSEDLQAYLPRQDALRSEDQAEALEPVELDFDFKKSHEEEDDDVDMIPLIDVTLVLLIFFMLTAAAGASMATAIAVPPAANPVIDQINPAELSIGIDLKDNVPIFSLGIGNTQSVNLEDRNIRDYGTLLKRIQETLAGANATDVTINAHREVRSGLVRQLTADLRRGVLRGKVARVLIGVNEKRP